IFFFFLLLITFKRQGVKNILRLDRNYHQGFLLHLSVKEIPFSKPIQCTDEQTDDLCNPWAKKDTNRDVSLFPSIASRGMGPDEEENSVESLSKLNVKFPPTDSDTEFLESSPETIPILNTLMTENVLPNQPFNMDLRDQEVSFNKMNSIWRSTSNHCTTSVMQNRSK
ncbi:hypothetical protein E2320_020263, partial [Naja naja]